FYPVLGQVLIPFPNDVYENGWIKNAPEFSELYRYRLAEASLAGRRPSLCLPSSTVVLRTLPLPRMKRKQAKALLQFQIENELRLPFANPVFDFDYYPRAFPATEEALDNKLESLALMAAAPGDLVARVDETFREMGLPLAAIEVKGLTCLRALRALRRVPEEGTLLIHFGPDTVDAHYYLQGQLLLSRWLDLNPQDYVPRQMPAAEGTVRPADAEAAASQVLADVATGSADAGASLDDSGSGGMDARGSGEAEPAGPDSALTWMHLESDSPAEREVFAADLQYQIDRLFSFLQYTLRRDEQVVTRLWLAGRIPYQTEIAAQLSAHLGLPVEPLDQPRAPNGDVVDLAAFGAALRGVIPDED
ncbi:MAG: hypothetical protein IRY98_13010, partial [Alicyclobacillaceae bacterium]|nr:hypothetical protein [Alicyclobacillaceae bacterium]